MFTGFIKCDCNGVCIEVNPFICTTSTSTSTSTTTTSTSTTTTTTTTAFCPNCIQGDTVDINGQIWDKCNLNVSNYRDGTPIHQATSDADWLNKGLNQIGAWCYVNNDPLTEPIYGKLYNWYAANNIINGGIAPLGKHIPTNAEWDALTTFLGGTFVAGGKLKETGLCHWLSPNTDATNSSGWTGLPAGYRYFNGTFFYIGNFGFWWGSSENDTTIGWPRALEYTSGNFGIEYNGKEVGYSIRCIKDNNTTTTTTTAACNRWQYAYVSYTCTSCVPIEFSSFYNSNPLTLENFYQYGDIVITPYAYLGCDVGVSDASIPDTGVATCEEINCFTTTTTTTRNLKVCKIVSMQALKVEGGSWSALDCLGESVSGTVPFPGITDTPCIEFGTLLLEDAVQTGALDCGTPTTTTTTTCPPFSTVLFGFDKSFAVDACLATFTTYYINVACDGESFGIGCILYTDSCLTTPVVSPCSGCGAGYYSDGIISWQYDDNLGVVGSFSC